MVGISLFLNEGLISQSIEAWKFGPVIPEVYREFKEFKGNAIARRAPIGPGYLTPTPNKERLLENVGILIRTRVGFTFPC